MMIGPYTVTNSNANASSRNRVTVKLEGVILACVYPPISNPLKFIRTHPLSEARAEFVGQLTLCGVSAEDVAMLLKLPPKDAK